ERKLPLPKECPQCGVLKPVRVVECPCCGFRPAHGPKGIEVTEGELVELTPKKLNRTTELAEKARWFAEVKTIGFERGYKPGWPAALYRRRHGVWPNDPRIRQFAPAPGSMEVRNWVRSRAIAFAKRKPDSSAKGAMGRLP